MKKDLLLPKQLIDELKITNPNFVKALAKEVFDKEPRFPVTNVHHFVQGNAEEVIQVWPGSFLAVPYLTDLIEGMGDIGIDVIGVNYPGYEQKRARQNVDRITLVDYIHAAYYKSLELSQGKSEVYLIGHSLGTIVVQALVLLSFLAESNNRPEMVLPITKIVIMGGGPPKLRLLVDYPATILTRSHTLGSVMQMMKRPDLFASKEGDMKLTLEGEETYQRFVDNGWVLGESASVMKSSFSGELSYVPVILLEKMGVRALFVYAPDDYFVAKVSTEEAIRQWGADGLESRGHSGMIMGEIAHQNGRAIAHFLVGK